MLLREHHSYQKTSHKRLLLCLFTLAALFTFAACQPGLETEVPIPVSDLPALQAVTAAPETSSTPENTDTPLPTIALTVMPNAATQPPIVDYPNVGYTLTGIVFFDRNGDGQKEEVEPVIAGVHLCLLIPGEGTCEQSDHNGVYRFENLTPGTYGLRLESPTSDPSRRYRYVMQTGGYVDVPAYYINGGRVSKQHLPEVKILSVEENLEVSLGGDTLLDMALAQGYLTDPFTCSDRARISETHQYDLDPERGKVRNYKGETSMEFTSSGRITDNHRAIDWGNSNRNVIGLPVRAAAPGIVAFVGEDYTTHGNCRMVTLAHPDTGHKTGYVHLEKILVNDKQEVLRGQILGTLGDSCTEWPHLHFTFNTGWEPGSEGLSNVDPYRDTQDPDSITWWTVDNDPVCLEVE